MWVAVPDEHNCIQDHKRKKHIYSDRDTKSMSTETRRNELQSVCLYVIMVTSKFGIPSTSAKCNSNMYRTQLSHTDNNEVYIH